MNKLEQNALRIAELMGWKYQYTDRWSRIETYSKNELTESSVGLKRLFSSYNGLMDIVFESKKSKIYTINILAVSVVFGRYAFFDEFETIHGKSFKPASEESFIEAIQECVIKYLELKND